MWHCFTPWVSTSKRLQLVACGALLLYQQCCRRSNEEVQQRLTRHWKPSRGWMTDVTDVTGRVQDWCHDARQATISPSLHRIFFSTCLKTISHANWIMGDANSSYTVVAALALTKQTNIGIKGRGLGGERGWRMTLFQLWQIVGQRS